MKYTQIPADTFQQIQLNAGILLDNFDPETAEIGSLLGATTGGINFTDTPEFVDFGEDIDNCPKNTMELKKLDSREVKMTGTFVTVTVDTAKLLSGIADIDSNNSAHIVPRNDLEASDFTDIWWVGDYSDENTGANAGFVAIHLMNALSTTGFQIQSTDKAKGQFAFEFTGHYSISAQSVVPYEIYIQSGSSSTPNVSLNKHVLNLAVNAKETLLATVVPSGSTVTWTSSATGKATVTTGGEVEGKQAGSAVITASITVNGVNYTDTCTVVVSGA